MGSGDHGGNMASPGPTRITSRDISAMAEHWLRTPLNGYLGSRYGSDLKSLLQTPMAAGLADGVIAKLRQDVPLLMAAPPGMVNLYAEDVGVDQKLITLEVSGELLEVDGVQFESEASAFTTATPATALIDTISESAANSLHIHVHDTMPEPGYW